MKMPFHGEIKIVPNALPEPVKQDLLYGNSRRYIWANLSKPVLQIGHEFSFIVFPLNLTPEGAFEHTGSLVLCQTEAEAKESMEMLSEAGRETLAILQTPGFGGVGKLTNIRHFSTEISVRFRRNADGTAEWWAFERGIDKATGEVTILRPQAAADELEAKRFAEQWRSEIESNKRKIGEPAAILNAPPPANCRPFAA